MKQSTPEECVVKVSCLKKMETIIDRKTTQVSKGPEVTLRNFWDHKNCNAFPKPTRTMHNVVSSSVFMHEMTWYSRNNRRLWCSKAEHYLNELRKQIQIHKLYLEMILKELRWHLLILHNWKKSIQRHHRKSRDKEGRSLGDACLGKPRSLHSQ